MPLADYVAEVMRLLAAGDHPEGELLVQCARNRRRAERKGRYKAVFAYLLTQ